MPGGRTAWRKMWPVMYEQHDDGGNGDRGSRRDRRMVIGRLSFTVDVAQSGEKIAPLLDLLKIDSL